MESELLTYTGSGIERGHLRRLHSGDQLASSRNDEHRRVLNSSISEQNIRGIVRAEGLVEGGEVDSMMIAATLDLFERAVDETDESAESGGHDGGFKSGDGRVGGEVVYYENFRRRRHLRYFESFGLAQGRRGYEKRTVLTMICDLTSPKILYYLPTSVRKGSL